jgi:hypothetical protein
MVSLFAEVAVIQGCLVFDRTYHTTVSGLG